jgi:ferritin
LRSETDDETIEGLDWWLSENVKELAELTKIIAKTTLEPKKRRALVALIT